MKFVYIVFIQEQQSFDLPVSYVGVDPETVDFHTRNDTEAKFGRRTRVFTSEAKAYAYRTRLEGAIRRLGRDERELNVVVSKCRMTNRD